MKKYMFVVLSLLFVMHACEVLEDPYEEGGEPFLNIEQPDVNISNEGGSKTVAFATNVSWTATPSDNWCQVSPVSGDRGNNTVTVTIDKNTNFDERNCTITIKADNIIKTVTVKQGKNLGLIVSQDRYELSNQETTIEVIVSANVSFEIMVSDDWISDLSARGYTESKFEFLIAENTTYKDREGTITIKELDGEQEEVVTIIQSKENVIILSEKEVEVSFKNQSIDVKYKTNVDIEVVIAEEAAEWVSIATTRGLRDEVLSLDIAENTAMESRTADITIKDKNSPLVDKLTITQQAALAEGVVMVDVEGTLGTILSQTDKDTITTLVLQGVINEDDFKVMKTEMPNLMHVDLTNVKCKDNKIPGFAFGDIDYPNTKLTTISLPKDITTIGEYAFYGCIGLKGALNIPESVTTIEPYAFVNCYNFTGDLTLPSGLTSIGNYTFFACAGFTGDLIIPDKVTAIGSLAFYNCTGFNGNLMLPDALTEIGAQAFIYCTGLTGDLIIPDKITAIAPFAFYGCSGFTGNLVLPQNATTIGKAAFYKCSGLTGDLILPAQLTEIGTQAFTYCSGFTGSLVIPDGVTTIENAVFYDCHGFDGTLTLPNEVTSIEYAAFYNCSGLTGDLILPTQLTEIGEYAFSTCPGFTGRLTIPDGVTTISADAFYDCEGLTALTLGKNVTTINENAFNWCYNISGDIVFPESLVSIAPGAFQFCSSVDAFQFPHTTPIQYYENTYEMEVTIKVPYGAVSTYQSTDGWKEHTIEGY